MGGHSNSKTLLLFKESGAVHRCRFKKAIGRSPVAVVAATATAFEVHVDMIMIMAAKQKLLLVEIMNGFMLCRTHVRYF